MPRDGAVHVIVSSTWKPVGEKKSTQRTALVTQALVKVVLPIQELWSCSLSDTRNAVISRRKQTLRRPPQNPGTNVDSPQRDGLPHSPPSAPRAA